MDKTTETNKSFIAKGDELLRHLNILDTLAQESLDSQLKFFEKTIRNSTNRARSIQLKWIASKKYLLFDDVKRSLLKSNGFIDIDTFEIPDKNAIRDIVRRCNMTLFFNMLFSNFDRDEAYLPNVNHKLFFNYIVPPNMEHSEEIWDLDLNLRIQIYIYKMCKNSQKNVFNNMFPKKTEGPPIYKETYRKVYDIIKRYSEDVENLKNEFKWENFAKKMFKSLSNIANDLEIPLLYKYTSNETSLMSSTSPRSAADCATPKNVNSTDVENQDVLPNNLNDSFSQNEEMVEQMMSHVNINDQMCLNNQNNQQNESVIDDTDPSYLSSNSDESYTSTSSQGTTGDEQGSNDNDQQSITDLVQVTTPSSLTSRRSGKESVYDRETSLEQSSVGSSAGYTEGSTRIRGKKRVRLIDGSDNQDDVKIVTKRVKNMWDEQELNALEEGMRQYGKTWTNIKKHYGNKGQVLEHRTPTQIKDKARSEYAHRQRNGIDPGVFGIMGITEN